MTMNLKFREGPKYTGTVATEHGIVTVINGVASVTTELGEKLVHHNAWEKTDEAILLDAGPQAPAASPPPRSRIQAADSDSAQVFKLEKPVPVAQATQVADAAAEAAVNEAFPPKQVEKIAGGKERLVTKAALAKEKASTKKSKK